MRFVMTELAGLDAVAKLPGYEDLSPDIVEAILDEAGKFARDVLAPINDQGDREGCNFKTVRSQPPKVSRRPTAICRKRLECMPATRNLGGKGCPGGIHRGPGDVARGQHGFRAVPDADPGCRRGFSLLRHRRAEGALSPEHGVGRVDRHDESDRVAGRLRSAAVRTKAVPEGDHYRIFGPKIFITYGEHDMTENIIHLVLARTRMRRKG